MCFINLTVHTFVFIVMELGNKNVFCTQTCMFLSFTLSRFEIKYWKYLKHIFLCMHIPNYAQTLLTQYINMYICN